MAHLTDTTRVRPRRPPTGAIRLRLAQLLRGERGGRPRPDGGRRGLRVGAHLGPRRRHRGAAGRELTGYVAIAAALVVVGPPHRGIRTRVRPGSGGRVPATARAPGVRGRDPGSGVARSPQRRIAVGHGRARARGPRRLLRPLPPAARGHRDHHPDPHRCDRPRRSSVGPHRRADDPPHPRVHGADRPRHPERAEEAVRHPRPSRGSLRRHGGRPRNAQGLRTRAPSRGHDRAGHARLQARDDDGAAGVVPLGLRAGVPGIHLGRHHRRDDRVPSPLGRSEPAGRAVRPAARAGGVPAAAPGGRAVPRRVRRGRRDRGDLRRPGCRPHRAHDRGRRPRGGDGARDPRRSRGPRSAPDADGLAVGRAGRGRAPDGSERRGKSSVLAALLGYADHSGEIRLDGRPAAHARAAIAWAGQRPDSSRAPSRRTSRSAPPAMPRRSRRARRRRRGGSRTATRSAREARGCREGRRSASPSRAPSTARAPPGRGSSSSTNPRAPWMPRPKRTCGGRCAPRPTPAPGCCWCRTARPRGRSPTA